MRVQFHSTRTLATEYSPPATYRLRNWAYYLFLLPASLLFVVFVGYPIVWIALQSVLGTSENGALKFIGLAGYTAVLEQRTFWTVVVNMFLWGVITVPVQMLIGGTLAYFIERHTRRLRGFFRTMFFLPVVTSVSVISLVWAQIYAPYYCNRSHSLVA